MCSKDYPLLPGQTRPEPYSSQVPTEEYESLKQEVKRLREITAGARTTIDDVVEIGTLTSEVKALREMNVKAQARITELERMDTEHTVQIAKMNGYISTLEKENESLKYSVATLDTDLAMSQRWHKCSEELPPKDLEGEDFIVSNGFYSVICEWRGYWNNEPFMGDKNCDRVKYYMQAPKAPEGK